MLVFRGVSLTKIDPLQCFCTDGRMKTRQDQNQIIGMQGPTGKYVYIGISTFATPQTQHFYVIIFDIYELSV